MSDIGQSIFGDESSIPIVPAGTPIGPQTPAPGKPKRPAARLEFKVYGSTFFNIFVDATEEAARFFGPVDHELTFRIESETVAYGGQPAWYVAEVTAETVSA